MNRSIASLLFLVIFSGGCAIRKPIVQTDLYFGLNVRHGKAITDSAWNAFVQNEVSRVFSKGFTVIRSEGVWVEPHRKEIEAEPSRIVSSVNVMTPATSEEINKLREKYKTLFHQESVLRVDKKANIHF